jgi:hypothetical protein
MYLAKTKDEEVEKLIHQTLRKTTDDMEANGQECNRPYPRGNRRNPC